ncbi:hypothetical protein F5Y18DRAFT_392388 [Xylariaceae sp. FL1019]|nr:hypothetical protein F5Y18DRAFT_392388 [Xylariaceae sp. FL1019]
MSSESTTFGKALVVFMNEPSRKRRPSFIADDPASCKVTADDVQQDLLSLEFQHSLKFSRRVLRPIFEAVIDYDSVITTLVSADPLPSALIWGSLKAGIECFKRYNSLFEKIETHLKKLTCELRRLTTYDELFRESRDMEKLLVASYVHILKFWAAVEEICLTSSLLLVAKSILSVKTRRLDNIIADITATSDDIVKLVPIVQERLRRGERDDLVLGQRITEITLDSLVNNTQREREARRRNDVQQWIRNGRSLNDSNDRNQHKYEKILLPGTGAWIHADKDWQLWHDIHSGANCFWLNGAPGVGKSVLCASVAQRIRQWHKSYAVVSQYFSFDEEASLSDIYRNIAEQLFHQLYSAEEDVSDHVYEVIQSPGNEATTSLKRLIKIFTIELKTTYIFLDGFDEEYSIKERWDNVCDVVTLFTNLAEHPQSTLKLWCSTQDRGKIRDLLTNALPLTLSASKNSSDIEVLFDTALRARNFNEFDLANSGNLLADLKQQVNGNFLWARLMLDTISDAPTLKQLRELVKEGLPEDFEKYLTNRILRTKRVNHDYLSKVLSCLVYAKRPLQLSELCEAISVSEIDFGQSVMASDRTYSHQIVDICTPWIRVEDANDDGYTDRICTLSHGAIQRFLIKRPFILSRGQNCEISPAVLADVCLKYLGQKKYRKPLKRTADNIFVTEHGENIRDHHLLGYCAKYWTRHLSDIEPFPELSTKVEKFVRSRNFNFTLQVQSLLVEGQFVVRSASNVPDKSRRLTRMFPTWFTDRFEAGKQLRRQYEEAICEWGYLLDKVSSVKGAHPSEIDRCLWGSLSKSNFLHKLPARHKCLSLESSISKEFEGLSSLVLDQIDARGQCIHVFQTDSFETDGTCSQLIHEVWSFTHDHSSKLLRTERLPITMQGLKYYRDPLREPMAGRVSTTAVSNDGHLFRIGNCLFIRTATSDFKPLKSLPNRLSYIEEFSCSGFNMAIASRRRITDHDFTSANDSDHHNRMRQLSFKSYVSEKIGGSRSTTSSSTRDSCSESDGADSDYERNGKIGEEGSAHEDSDGLKSQLEDDDRYEQLPNDSDAFLDTSSGPEPLSAEDIASDGSESMGSNEMDDERLWNDFMSDEDIDDEDGTVETRSHQADFDPEEPGALKHWIGERSDSRNTASSASKQSTADEDIPDAPSHQHFLINRYESSDSSDEYSSSEEEEMTREVLDRLIQPHRSSKSRRKISEISIFNVDQCTQEVKRIFHYWQFTANPIFASSPSFHPRSDLVVWPLGDESLLFANIARNRYFKQLINTGYGASCHISVQCQFSECGKYLHTVSLDGHLGKAVSRDIALDAHLVLKLHVSTYELSETKPERSPPRLIFQTSAALDRTLSKSQKIPVPNLPYTFTWTRTHVYVTESAKTLKTVRVSLFRDAGITTSAGSLTAARNIEDIYLPASAELRKVHFIPNEQHEAKTKSDVIATVVLSSCNAQPASLDSPGTDLHLPQICRITESQFGRGWRSIESRDDSSDAQKRNHRKTVRGLFTRFEKFDKLRDIDIIPFLA